jgi:hypothetical protein
MIRFNRDDRPSVGWSARPLTHTVLLLRGPIATWPITTAARDPSGSIW